MAYLAMLKNSSKILDVIKEADDFSKFNKFFLVHGYISGGIVVNKIRSVVFK